jgi:hypothetical protein
MDVFTTLRWIVRSDQKRKVQLVQRSDGTFGFQEWQFFQEESSWGTTKIGAGSRCATLEDAIREAKGRTDWLASELPGMNWYQLGWTTLPGLRGLSVSEFRAVPTSTPDNEKGVAIELGDQANCESFLRMIEAEFATKRFTNAADAFDSVKAFAIERASH